MEEPADQFRRMVAEVRGIAALHLERDKGSSPDVVAREDVIELFVCATRLYAAQVVGRSSAGHDLMVTPTEAVTAAAALLRSQQLTPFEFAIWYADEGYSRGMEEDE